MANGTTGDGGAWKWIATVSLTVMLAGSPGIVYASRTWNLSGDVTRISDRQVEMGTRLAILEQQVKSEHELVMELRAELRALKDAR